MVKAYFFDWEETLAFSDGWQKVKTFLTDEQQFSLLTKPFGDADVPESHRGEIHSKLTKARYILYGDSQRVISKLKNQYELAIVSNMYGTVANRIRGLFPDFLSQFGTVILSSEVGLVKPNPKIFLYALNRLNKNLSPKEIMMVGNDMDLDIRPACNLGMKTMLVDRKKQTLGDLLNL